MATNGLYIGGAGARYMSSHTVTPSSVFWLGTGGGKGTDSFSENKSYLPFNFNKIISL